MMAIRRGEASGLVWDDPDLDEGIAYISRQLQQGANGQLKAGPLKTLQPGCHQVRALGLHS